MSLIVHYLIIKLSLKCRFDFLQLEDLLGSILLLLLVSTKLRALIELDGFAKLFDLLNLPLDLSRIVGIDTVRVGILELMRVVDHALSLGLPYGKQLTLQVLYLVILCLYEPFVILVRYESRVIVLDALTVALLRLFDLLRPRDPRRQLKALLDLILEHRAL